jgi:hypothetical protein
MIRRATKKWTIRKTVTTPIKTRWAVSQFDPNIRPCGLRKSAIALALLVSVLLLVEGCEKKSSGPGGVPLPDHFRIPDAVLAKPIAQLQKNWCWAASAEMVLSSRGHSVSQCDQANLYPHDHVTSCCPEDPNCNYPQFPVLSFKPGKTDYKRNRTPANPVLSPEILEEEIAIYHRPVIFSWRDCEKHCGPAPTGHMMVLVGYQTIGGKVIFDVLDPWPPHKGGNIPNVNYNQFVAYQPGKSHWDDFYAFKDGEGNEYQ